MSHGKPTDHEINVASSEFVLNGGDQVKAWRKAFPKSKAKPESQHVRATEFFKSSKLQVRIAEIQIEQSEKDKKEFDLSAEQLKKTLAAVMKSGLATTYGKPQLSAVVSAVSELNKMNGNHSPTKTDHLSSDGSMSPTKSAADYTDEELAKLIDEQ